LSRLHFIELTARISIPLGQKKSGQNIELFLTLQIAIRTSPKMLIMKLSRWTPKLEKNCRSK